MTTPEQYFQVGKDLLLALGWTEDAIEASRRNPNPNTVGLSPCGGFTDAPNVMHPGFDLTTLIVEYQLTQEWKDDHVIVGSQALDYFTVEMFREHVLVRTAYRYACVRAAAAIQLKRNAGAW